MGPWRRPPGRGVREGTCDGWNERPSDSRVPDFYTSEGYKMVPPYFIYLIFAFGKWSNHLDLLQEHTVLPLSESGLQHA